MAGVEDMCVFWWWLVSVGRDVKGKRGREHTDRRLWFGMRGLRCGLGLGNRKTRGLVLAETLDDMYPRMDRRGSLLERQMMVRWVGSGLEHWLGCGSGGRRIESALCCRWMA